MGNSVFSYPKPVSLIRELISTSVGPSDIVMDFFAGSGTTAQAILELNNTDDGNRKFILVQLPEKTEDTLFPTITHVTRERVRRVIRKLDEKHEGKLELKGRKPSRGFRAFKLSSSNFKIWDAEKTPDDPAKLAEQLKLYADNVDDKRTQQDILYELIVKSGLPLSSKIERIDVAGKPVWSVNDNKLLILLENNVSRDMLRGMLALKPQQMLCLDAAFGGDDALKTNTVLEAKSLGVAFHTI
jgi:adenine-specific DNA-methyltransferase